MEGNHPEPNATDGGGMGNGVTSFIDEVALSLFAAASTNQSRQFFQYCLFGRAKAMSERCHIQKQGSGKT